LGPNAGVARNPRRPDLDGDRLVVGLLGGGMAPAGPMDGWEPLSREGKGRTAYSGAHAMLFSRS
jgi:hypothetical protein